MQNDKIKIQEACAFSFSFLLHMLFLVFLYLMPLHAPYIPQSTSYQIALQPTKVTSSDEKITKGKQPNPLSKKSIDTNKKYVGRSVKKISVKKKSDITYLRRNRKKRKTLSPIDKRGLYTNNKHIKKSTGALLDLAGWTWDIVPQPQDTTTETGKIVFEIKVDKYGEIVAIRTLEKTITPLLEKIYEDSLSGLTFSKTSSTHLYTNISIGKVTFLIQAR